MSGRLRSGVHGLLVRPRSNTSIESWLVPENEHILFLPISIFHVNLQVKIPNYPCQDKFHFDIGQARIFLLVACTKTRGNV